MKKIPLTRGYVALVDDEDYEWISEHKWCAIYSRGVWYAATGSNPMHIMHRVILDVYDSKIQVDHKDHNGLNNQRSNLRIATQQENTRNRTKRSNTSSQYKGVHWDSQRGKWTARITISGKRYALGRFTNEIDAAMAYDNAAKEAFGEFANLNLK